MAFKIEVDDDAGTYQLVVDDQESGVSDFGEQNEVEVADVLYFTTVLSAEDAENAVIYRMVKGVPEVVTEKHQVEDFEFELEDEEEDEEEGDEGDDVEVPA